MFKNPWIRRPDFNNLPELTYDGYWKSRGWKPRNHLKSREEIILEKIPAGAKVFDIGCGNSLLPIKLKEKGCDVRVGDISEIVLDGYRAYDIKTTVIDLLRIKEYSLPKEHFDYIVLSEVLEHIQNAEQVVTELSTMTDRFMITVPNSAAYMFRYGLAVRGRFFTQWVYHPTEHVRFWSHIDFLDWLRALGLTIELITVTDGFSFRGLIPKLPNIWKNLLGFRMLYVCKTTLKD